MRVPFMIGLPTKIFGSSVIRSRFASDVVSSMPQIVEVSVVSGLQASWFDEREFYGQAFKVAPASNRMGLRLQGDPLTMPKRELVSEPVCPGAIQVTPDGQCIVLGVDGQTIGGYLKIAHVIAADLDRIAQLRPGQQIHFERISIDAAEVISDGRRRNLRKWLTALRLAAA